MTAREQIFGDIRKALKRAAGQPPLFEATPLAAPALRIPQMDRNLYADLFVQKFENLGGKSFRVRNTSAVVPAIAELLVQKTPSHRIRLFYVSAASPDSFRSTPASPIENQLKEACAAADIGITSVDYALAATGSFVMLSSPHEARLISLLAARPHCHLSALAPAGESRSVARHSSPPRRSNQFHGVDHRPQPHGRHRANPGSRRPRPGRSLRCHRR